MGIVERKQRERNLRKTQILDAAKKIFLAKGFSGTTIEEIARAAEISSGTIYLYFKNKDDLYASLNLKTLDSLNRRLGKTIANTQLTIEEKLDRAWKSLYKVFRSDPIALRVVFHFQLEDSLQLLSPPMLSSLNKVSKSIINRIALIFQGGIDEGRFLERNAMAMADVFMSLFIGLVLWEDAKRRLDPRKDYRHLNSGV